MTTSLRERELEKALQAIADGELSVDCAAQEFAKITLETFSAVTEKPFASPLTLTLSRENRVIMQIDAWYLILSAILRAEPPFKLNTTLTNAMLTARIEMGGQEFVFSIPQPVEFIEDSQNET